MFMMQIETPNGFMVDVDGQQQDNKDAQHIHYENGQLNVYFKHVSEKKFLVKLDYFILLISKMNVMLKNICEKTLLFKFSIKFCWFFSNFFFNFSSLRNKKCALACEWRETEKLREAKWNTSELLITSTQVCTRNKLSRNK